MPTRSQYLVNSIRDHNTSLVLANVYNETNPVTSAVTQLTSRATGVLVATKAGSITTNNTALAAETSASFVVTCPGIAVGDVPVISQRSGAVGLMTSVEVSGVGVNNFTITVSNNNAAAGAAETGAIIINYAVIQARV